MHIRFNHAMATFAYLTQEHITGPKPLENRIFTFSLKRKPFGGSLYFVKMLCVREEPAVTAIFLLHKETALKMLRAAILKSLVTSHDAAQWKRLPSTQRAPAVFVRRENRRPLGRSTSPSPPPRKAGPMAMVQSVTRNRRKVLPRMRAALDYSSQTNSWSMRYLGYRFTKPTATSAYVSRRRMHNYKPFLASEYSTFYQLTRAAKFNRMGFLTVAQTRYVILHIYPSFRVRLIIAKLLTRWPLPPCHLLNRWKIFRG